MGIPARIFTRARAYGSERFPREGGVVLAINHLHWIDIPIVGALSPRNIDFVAKVEAAHFPGLGRFIRWHGTIAVRRGESDRDAVRRMREAARNGRVLGLFVEGTRQRSGVPGEVKPGAAMVALQEGVPVVVGTIYGSQLWRLGNFAPVTVSWSEPLRFDGLPRNAKGYREASAEIGRTIRRHFDFLAEVHELGRPAVAVPPR